MRFTSRRANPTDGTPGSRKEAGLLRDEATSTKRHAEQPPFYLSTELIRVSDLGRKCQKKTGFRSKQRNVVNALLRRGEFSVVLAKSFSDGEKKGKKVRFSTSSGTAGCGRQRADNYHAEILLELKQQRGGKKKEQKPLK